MKIKPGASIDGSGPEILRAAIIIEPLFESRGIDLVITSGTESIEIGSRPEHDRGDALDLRSNTVTDKEALRREAQHLLGGEYFIVLENIGEPDEHYHLRYEAITKQDIMKLRRTQ